MTDKNFDKAKLNETKVYIKKTVSYRARYM